MEDNGGGTSHAEWVERLVMQRIHDLEKIQNQRFADYEKLANTKFQNIDMLMGKLNELRSEVISDRRQFLMRDRYEVQHESLRSQIDELKDWRSNQEGKQSRSQLISVLAIIVALSVGLLQVVAHFWGK